MVTVTQKNGVYCVIIENPDQRELSIIEELRRKEEGAQSEWEYWSLGPQRPNHYQQISIMDEAFQAFCKEETQSEIQSEIPFD